MTEKKDTNQKKRSRSKKILWFSVFVIKDRSSGWSAENDLIFKTADALGIESAYIQTKGSRLAYIHCTESKKEDLLDMLGRDAYGSMKIDEKQMEGDKEFLRYYKSPDEKDQTAKKGKDSLDEQLKGAVSQYNSMYTMLNEHGKELFNQRVRSIDLLEHVENLVNSIANKPKTFDTDIKNIQVNKKEFQDVCDFAEKELTAAKQSAFGAGAGIAGGMAVASLAPSAAMWIATTFGTASTGTAISTLSGAAAHSAALAWLGGGTLAMHGGGMVAGQAFLALAGPVGWGVAGATLLASIALFANKRIKLDKEKKEEIDKVLKNTQALRKSDASIHDLLKITEKMRMGLNKQYTQSLVCYGKNYLELPEDDQKLMQALVNNAKALAASLSKGV